MKKVSLLAIASLFAPLLAQAISLDEIQLWTGSGTNRAALVVEWNTPEFFNLTTVPAPVANKTLVWGYRFNGAASGAQMFNAIVAANPQLYAVEAIDPFFGTGIQAIGFNLNGSGIAGVTDGTNTDLANAFTNGILIDASLRVDAARPLNSGDLFWSGHYGPYWQLWNELGDSGGFVNSPNRGTNQFWDGNTYTHGEWASAYYGLDDLMLTNGSWIGFSISAAGYPTDTNDPSYSAEMAAFNNDEQAPPSPEGNYVAYVCNTNDFAVQIVNSSNVYTTSPYNVPGAVLGHPTLKFIDHFGLGKQAGKIDRSKIIEPPYWTDPHGNNVITEINPGGQITVNMGRKIYDDANNPYGIDLIVYGNSFYSASGIGSAVTDGADMSVARIPSGSASGIAGHTTVVSVSQDGTNWYSYPQVSAIYPDDSYRWDNTNHSWTEEQMNETKPLNPTMSFPANSTVANALDQFIGACGGTGFDLKPSGLPWIQYVRVSAVTNTGVYTVIDAIGAVDPVVVGDALSITPSNIISGMTNLVFQKPVDSSQNLISLNFGSVSAIAKVSTVSLNEFSSFAPFIGNVSKAYQITLRPVNGSTPVSYVATAALRAGDNYTGNGSDLRVYQWVGTNWTSQPFNFNPTNNEVLVAGVTNFSAFVVAQISPSQLGIQPITHGFAFQFMPVANCTNIVERSVDLITWTPISTNTPGNAQVITLADTNAPVANAFYRVRANP